MRNRFLVVMAGLLGAALVFPLTPSAQNSSTATWPQPVPNRPLPADKDRKPAPRRNHQLPYTPYGLELYKLRPAANGGPYGQLAPAVLADGTTIGSVTGRGERGRGAAAQ